MSRPNGIGDLQWGERYCNMDLLLSSALPNTIFLGSEELSAQDMCSQNTDPPSPSDAADPAPGQIRPGPAIVGLSKALEGLRAMQARDHMQRILDTTRAAAEATAFEQDRLRKEAEAQAATAYKKYLSRECPSSQEYQDCVERSHRCRVAAKDAEAAAWRHAFQVTRLQGVGVSGTLSSLLRLQRRFERRRAERQIAWSAEAAAAKQAKHAWDVARLQGVGTSTAPSAVLRKTKYCLFSPTPAFNDQPSFSGDERGKQL